MADSHREHSNSVHGIVLLRAANLTVDITKNNSGEKFTDTTMSLPKFTCIVIISAMIPSHSLIIFSALLYERGLSFNSKLIVSSNKLIL